MENMYYRLQTMEKSVREVTDFHLKQINYEGNNEIVKLWITPTIILIISKILDKEKCYSVIKDNFRGINSDELIKLVNVNDITNTLIDYCENYVPYTNKYLPNIDIETESINLFCYNYVFGLIKKVGKN